ncbi:unnamed protein product [Acanthoscelides obtectus]|uniref:Uncharacterized protein n=1 Tax=Acanthoscelides obtectus TaxID=200917 RepID=A0A9P0LZA2_ACAOB|nr:unnamed protein product [Acanthoscelides obtectus]CAK1674347.1 hypothetical protein AOBTE_LOCUS29599 [Acanthoscelides obtectus]
MLPCCFSFQLNFRDSNTRVLNGERKVTLEVIDGGYKKHLISNNYT